MLFSLNMFNIIHHFMKAVVKGDPHLKTLDGLEYSFNGVGEFHFILSKNASFESQIRFEQAKNTQGNGVTYVS